ncbi:MAG: hypothetical protein JWN03_4842 [Nocardia sp.]|nr:hypothetical protein [Nocardia sp.]
MVACRASPVTARGHTFSLSTSGEKAGYPVSFIPTKFPVTMVADTHEYQVFDASAFGDAMFAHGHRVKEDAEPAVAAPKPAKRAK